MGSTFTLFIGYLVRVAAVTFVQLFTLFGPGLVLVLLLSQLSAHVARQGMQVLGRGPYLLIFGGIGTLVHELGHAIAALLFGFTILGFKGFPTNSRDRVLGYVVSGTTRITLWKTIGFFFIGIAPVLFGTLFLFAALMILFDRELAVFMNELNILNGAAVPGAGNFASQVLRDCIALVIFIFQPAHWLDWRFYVFLYLAFAVGSSIHLSPPDISAAVGGFYALVALWFGFNLVTLWISGMDEHSADWIGRSYVWFYGILAVVIMLNLIAAAVLLVPATLRASSAKH